MTMGVLTAFDGEIGIITADSGELVDVHCIHMPRRPEPLAGHRVSFEIVRELEAPAYARGVWIILDGAKPPAVEQWGRKLRGRADELDTA